jgi:hypothetical protein
MHAARRADRDHVRRGVNSGADLRLFAGQLFVWRQLQRGGYFVSTSAARLFIC